MISDIYYEQHEVDEGIKMSKNKTEVFKLATHMLNTGQSLRCWCCRREVNAVLTMQARKDPALFKTLAHVHNGRVERFNVDHIIPRGLGGKDNMENYRLSCIKCNHERDITMSPEDIMFLAANLHLCEGGKKVYNNIKHKVSPYYYVGTVQTYDQAHYVY